MLDHSSNLAAQDFSLELTDAVEIQLVDKFAMDFTLEFFEFCSL
jgi:hypothetical protein